MAAFFGEHQQPTVHKISLKIHILDLRVVPTSQNYAHFTSVKVLPKTSLCLLHSGGNAVQPNI